MATLLWAAGKRSWNKLNDPPKKAIRETDKHFRGNGLPFPASRIESILEGKANPNANAGGDNVHRGMVLGILLGAVNKELPEYLKQGLIAFDELQTEIEAFSEIALSGKAI